MIEMVTASWDNQGWPGEGQQETQHPTAWSGAHEMRQEEGCSLEPQPSAQLPKSSASFLSSCMFPRPNQATGSSNGGVGTLRSRHPKEWEGTSLSPTPCTPSPPWEVIFSLSVGATSERG